MQLSPSLRRSLFAVALSLAVLPGIIPSALAQTPAAPNAGASAPNVPAVRRRIAVLQFDMGSEIYHWWGDYSWNIGKGVSEIVEKELVKDGTYALFTRQALEAIAQEKQINEKDPSVASKLGSLAGVGAIVRGTVTQFGFDNKNFAVGGGVVGKAAGPFGALLGGFKKNEAKATVVVDAQIISVATGEILATATGKGESKRGSLGAIGGIFGNGSGTVAGVDMGSSNFENTIIGEATRKCVEALTKELAANSAKVPATSRKLTGKVADVEANSLILNIGSEDGVQVGDTLTVERILRTVKDPDTGAVISEKTEQIGTIRVTEVEAKTATGTFSGAGKPKAGDRVKLR